MNETKQLKKDADRVLKETSRTFYIPISRLSTELQEAVGAAYLAMRAIDEIEDHEELAKDVKSRLLRETALLLRGTFDTAAYGALIAPYADLLPEVTIRLGDWVDYCPEGIRSKVLDSTAEMAEGMAAWAERDWLVETEADLDEYTYYVAGLVGVMLSDVWEWKAGIVTDKEQAIGFGRGLQAVNILRNQGEDAERGVGYFPPGWTTEDMFAYARANLAQADAYLASIPKKTTIHQFCNIPLALAHGTLDALSRGKEKLSRPEVLKIVGGAMLKG
ncbi:squalene/phytoene synthase family protein [Exiguobacterium flavidum]|uniref:squalene/phytoene synthase family protein n=1 Tax=Exiguobacterium flavidum TaxID=2184695 RepID=UPI000DF7DD34|nr:phytoene/squalene synthase family protein [Exiguobacterium flavidum]